MQEIFHETPKWWASEIPDWCTPGGWCTRRVMEASHPSPQTPPCAPLMELFICILYNSLPNKLGNASISGALISSSLHCSATKCRHMCTHTHTHTHSPCSSEAEEYIGWGKCPSRWAGVNILISTQATPAMGCLEVPQKPSGGHGRR